MDFKIILKTFYNLILINSDAKIPKSLMEKTNKIFAVYGAGGCGRGLISFVKQNFNSKNTRIIFIDDFSKEKKVDGYDVLKYATFKSIKTKFKYIIIGIANVNLRKKISKKIQKIKLISFHYILSKA